MRITERLSKAATEQVHAAVKPVLEVSFTFLSESFGADAFKQWRHLEE